jgi:hypothetical protein
MSLYENFLISYKNIWIIGMNLMNVKYYFFKKKMQLMFWIEIHNSKCDLNIYHYKNHGFAISCIL